MYVCILFLELANPEKIFVILGVCLFFPAKTRRDLTKLSAVTSVGVAAMKQTHNRPKLPTLHLKKCQTHTHSDTKKNIKHPHIWKSRRATSLNVECFLASYFCNILVFRCRMWANPLHMLGNAMKFTQ